MKNTTRQGGSPASIQREKHKEALQCFLMIGTQIIGFLVLSVYPIIWTFRWAFYAYDGIAANTRFIGLQNFISMFTVDLTYWRTWANTLLYAALKIPIELCLAMILALMLNRRLRGSHFFRAVFYLPNIISVAVVGLIFTNMFGYFGWVNGTLLKIGAVREGVDWFAGRGTAFAVLVTGGVWSTFGINVMYFMAALAGISEDIYESARLDGASGFTAFRKITVPMIAPVLQIILLLSLVGTLGVNEFILTSTNGAPGGQTLSVMAYLTRQFVPGFMAAGAKPRLGYGCAMSVVTTVIFAVVALAYDKVSKKMPSV
ncbi:MAG: sugar ABC transporter permease [Clostridiales bacterium]|nr:sugar ABC transporter permease [Clostridiales bacterium]